MLMTNQKVRSVIREMLRSELALDIKKQDGGISLQLKLAGDNVGNRYHISNELEWEVDKGHGGGRYVDSVDMNVIMGSQTIRQSNHD